MSKFGLIGKDISYSFSKTFFTEKFEKEGLFHSYQNFDIPNIECFSNLISENSELKGLNVTIPYKEKVIPYLDALDETAEAIGAVNVIKILEDKKLIGYNSDHFGFQTALADFLPLKKNTALILGTGGASKAVAFALKNLGFDYNYVSRTRNPNWLHYSELDQATIENNLLIVNCTPLGTSPNITACPPIPYQFLTENHLLFDLIYNPSVTQFLKLGKLSKAKTSNGLAMLEFQADRAWEIWNI